MPIPIMTARTKLERPRNIRLIAIAFLLLLAGACTTEERVTWVTVVFDVEDYTSPAPEGMDDIPPWQAEIMTDVGVKGTFFVIGEEARSLDRRGRTDVIAATGSLLALFAELLLDVSANEASDSYEITPFEPWPKTHDEEIVRRVESFKDWPVHRTDLDMSRIVKFTRLQLWTLKPAIER